MRSARPDGFEVTFTHPVDPAIHAEVVGTMSRINPEAYVLAAEAVWLADQRKQAAAIRCPTLVLYGSEDRITPAALSATPFTPGRPSVIVAHTIKGRGVSFMEGRLAYHYKNPSDDDLIAALAELEAGP